MGKPLLDRIAEHERFARRSIRDWLKEKDDLLREAAEALRKYEIADKAPPVTDKVSDH